MVPNTQLTHGSSGQFFLWTTEAAKQGAVVVILAPNQEDIQTLIIASAKPNQELGGLSHGAAVFVISFLAPFNFEPYKYVTFIKIKGNLASSTQTAS